MLPGYPRGPLFIVHGTGDELIPYQHALKLFERAGEPKRAFDYLRSSPSAAQEPGAVLPNAWNGFKKISSGKL